MAPPRPPVPISSEAPVAPVPAATVVLLRPASGGADGSGGVEVLLIHRPGSMTFGPGLHVFPGGKVDPEDAAGASPHRSLTASEAADRLGGIVSPSEALALHHAAVREVAEEVGLRLRPADLVPIARWTTPRFMPRRFATSFFAADLPGDARLVFAPDEVAAHRWIAPADALDALGRGELNMWVPTTSVLQQLDAIRPHRAADVAAAVRFGPIEEPRLIAERAGAVRIRVGAAGAVPGRAGETTLLGRRFVVVVDPGDPSEEAVDAITAAVDRLGGKLSAVVLSRSDPDHAAGAEAVAIPAGVPILAAPGAGRHLPYDVVEVRDGEELPSDVRLVIRLGPPGSGRLQVDAPWPAPFLSAGQ